MDTCTQVEKSSRKNGSIGGGENLRVCLWKLGFGVFITSYSTFKLEYSNVCREVFRLFKDILRGGWL